MVDANLLEAFKQKYTPSNTSPVAGSSTPPVEVSAADSLDYELKYASAQIVAAMLREMLPKGAEVFSQTSTNTISVVNAGPANAEKVRKVLTAIDVPAKGVPPADPTPVPASSEPRISSFPYPTFLAPKTTAPAITNDSQPVVIELKVLSSNEVTEVCRELLPKTVRVLALSQNNSIVLLDATPGDVAKLKKLLALIDVPAKGQPPIESIPANPTSVLPPLVPTPGMPLGATVRSEPLPLVGAPVGRAESTPVPLPQPTPPEPAPQPAKKPKTKPAAVDPNTRFDTTPAKKPKAKPPAVDLPSHMTPERIHGGIM